jgi:branched-chain amino acid transport system ATP-binding protein
VRAIHIIEDEHRSLAAVLHGLLYLVREIRGRGMKPPFDVLGAMVYYFDAFPERFHHPKEDGYLFLRLRARCPEARPLLDRLEAEHVAGAEKIRLLEQALARYQQGGDAEAGAFFAAVEAYSAFHWRHMESEEREVLPLAVKHLTPGDWEVIDDAFSGHADPLVGESSGEDYRKLFRRIVNIAPPPIGLGPQP